MTTSNKLEHTVFQYLNLSPEEKVEFFLATRSDLSRLASYWINFDTVKRHIDNFAPEFLMLDYLVGKSKNEIIAFFMERPELLTYIQILLGIRDNKLKKGVLTVQGLDGEYSINLKEIDTGKLADYSRFIEESGLLWLFQEGVLKSVRDYGVGVEAGMDSNGRKNRSGDIAESFLVELLKSIAMKRNWQFCEQTTIVTIEKEYGLNMADVFDNRRFNGSLFNPSRQELYLFEINNFNASGSKIKSSATEFQQLHDRLSRTPHQFIYITDGKGWDSDKSHLTEAMKYIGTVFNYAMLEAGFLDEYLPKESITYHIVNNS